MDEAFVRVGDRRVLVCLLARKIDRHREEAIAARLQHTEHFPHCRLVVVHMFEDMVGDHHIEAVVRPVDLRDVEAELGDRRIEVGGFIARIVLHRPHQPLLRAELQDRLCRKVDAVFVEIELQQAVALAAPAIRAARVPARGPPDREEDAVIAADGAGPVDFLARKLGPVLPPALQQPAEYLAPVDLGIMRQNPSACSGRSPFDVRVTMSGPVNQCQAIEPGCRESGKDFRTLGRM